MNSACFCSHSPLLHSLHPRLQLGIVLALASPFMADDAPVRRPILGILSIVLLFILYRIFAVYTVRSGECRPKPVDPSVRILTRDEKGRLVSFPERIGFPPQQRPLVVMTYNIEG